MTGGRWRRIVLGDVLAHGISISLHTPASRCDMSGALPAASSTPPANAARTCSSLAAAW